jgi:hypothetical protein
VVKVNRVNVTYSEHVRPFKDSSDDEFFVHCLGIPDRSFLLLLGWSSWFDENDPRRE